MIAARKLGKTGLLLACAIVSGAVVSLYAVSSPVFRPLGPEVRTATIVLIVAAILAGSLAALGSMAIMQRRQWGLRVLELGCWLLLGQLFTLAVLFLFCDYLPGSDQISKAECLIVVVAVGLSAYLLMRIIFLARSQRLRAGIEQRGERALHDQFAPSDDTQSAYRGKNLALMAKVWLLVSCVMVLTGLLAFLELALVPRTRAEHAGKMLTLGVGLWNCTVGSVILVGAIALLRKRAWGRPILEGALWVFLAALATYSLVWLHFLPPLLPLPADPYIGTVTLAVGAVGSLYTIVLIRSAKIRATTRTW